MIHSGAYAVYPRLCGERFSSSNTVRKFCGLSPALRGTQQATTNPTPIFRFIPGSAGNAKQTRLSPGFLAVYPRLCGERVVDRFPASLSAGLSPALRGTHWFWRWFQARLRFIPGSAGNASCRAVLAVIKPVYPRLCGERAIARPLRFFFRGLSPALRGTHEYDKDKGAFQRFIPGSAGNA